MSAPAVTDKNRHPCAIQGLRLRTACGPAQYRRAVASSGCPGIRRMKLPNTPNVTRRSFVASVGAATVLPPATALLADSAEAAPPASHHGATAPTEPGQSVYLFFNVA